MSEPLLTPAPVSTNPDAWVVAVRASWQTSGHRLTEPRTRVLRRIATYSAPFTAEQLYADLTGDEPPPGRATVYRVLEQLHDAGWLARLHPAGADAGYVATWPGHMHHLICTTCGKVVAFEGCGMSPLIEQLSRQTNFAIDGHLVQVYGRCAHCQVQA